MKLGDLEFKPEDFCEKSDENRKDCPHGVGNDWCAGTHWAGDANHILRKKLATVPEVEVNQQFIGTMFSPKLGMDTVLHQKDIRYRARLVCIEEIEK